MTDDTKREREGIVIVLPKRDPEVKPLMRVVRRPSCLAHEFTLDEQTRTAKCKRCECVFDGFDALACVARDWQLYTENREILKRDVKRLEESREELRRQVQNLKAQAKRAGGGQ